MTPTLDEHLDKLVNFESSPFPVISVYLNTQADQHGKPQFDAFLRKEFARYARTWPASSAERESYDADCDKILKWLESDLTVSANGVAIFACSAADLFETIQLDAPLDESRLYVYGEPHLYHLARLNDEYPRYVALLTDANTARIFVFGLGETLETEEVTGKKVQRVKVGGWSQARYQRRVQNAHKDHAKEVVDALSRIVEQDQISHIILAGDPQILTVVKDELPKQLADKVVDTLKLDVKAPEHEVFEKTLETMRQQDSQTDAEKVKRLFDLYRGRGLAVVGPEDTLIALENGQVDELLLSTTLEQGEAQTEPAAEMPDNPPLPDVLVTKATQTDAHISFIEDMTLLESVGGVGAFLRWR